MSRYALALAMMMEVSVGAATAKMPVGAVGPVSVNDADPVPLNDADPVPLNDADPVPLNDADPAMMCVFQRQLLLYRSGMHDMRSWPDVPRVEVCDIPIGPGRPRPRP